MIGEVLETMRMMSRGLSREREFLSRRECEADAHCLVSSVYRVCIYRGLPTATEPR